MHISVSALYIYIYIYMFVNINENHIVKNVSFELLNKFNFYS